MPVHGSVAATDNTAYRQELARLYTTYAKPARAVKRSDPAKSKELWAKYYGAVRDAVRDNAVR